MSCCLKSLKGLYRDYIGDYDRVIRGLLGA